MTAEESASDRFHRLAKVFAEAADMTAERRGAFIAQAAAGDATFENEVWRLLAADAQGTPPAEATVLREATVQAGPYLLDRVIGRGGMGVVYLGHRADGAFEQKVAIKLLSVSANSASFEERFRQERQILADLNHPNITRLLDGGVTAAGEPYLVMEYVDGVSISEYCRVKQLSLREIVSLFRQLCDAVAYAHQQLIVHLDLKPGNILVTADGVPKLLDFGIAKVLGKAGQRDITQAEASPMSVRYASPEQIQGQGIGTRSDVFSLGVILYELAGGENPFPEPAMRFNPYLAVRKPSEVKGPYAESLKGDLDQIAMKAIETDPKQRYDSVEKLSADLGRYLEGWPVEARPQTISYRTGKFIRRHRLGVGLAALAVVGLSVTTAAALFQANLARERYADLRSSTSSLLFEFRDAIEEVPGSMAAKQLLASRALKNLDKMAGATAKDPDLQIELAEAYRQMGDVQGSPYSQNLGDTKGAIESLSKARALAQSSLDGAPQNAAWLHELGIIEATTAEVYFGLGQAKEAIGHAQAGAAVYEKMAPLTKNAMHLADAGSNYGVLGDIYGQRGTASLADPAKATSAYQRAIRIDEQALTIAPGVARIVRGVGINRVKLGDLARATNPEQALQEFQKALALIDTLPAKELSTPATKRIRNYFLRKVGGALSDLQQWGAAEQSLRQTIAYHEAQSAADPNDSRSAFDLAVAHNDLAQCYFREENYAKARVETEAVIEVLNNLIQREPENRLWKLNRAAWRMRLSIMESRLGRPGVGAAQGNLALRELEKLVVGDNVSPQDFEIASEAYATIEPVELRDGKKALDFANRYLKIAGRGDVGALYVLARAHKAAGEMEHSKAVAEEALAKLPSAGPGGVSYIRKSLELLR